MQKPFSSNEVRWHYEDTDRSLEKTFNASRYPLYPCKVQFQSFAYLCIRSQSSQEIPECNLKLASVNREQREIEGRGRYFRLVGGCFNKQRDLHGLSWVATRQVYLDSLYRSLSWAQMVSTTRCSLKAVSLKSSSRCGCGGKRVHPQHVEESEEPPIAQAQVLGQVAVTSFQLLPPVMQ